LRDAREVGIAQLLTKDSRDWIGRARDLAPMIEAAAARTEKERRIPADVLAFCRLRGR
jgi:hypothetical protein